MLLPGRGRSAWRRDPQGWEPCPPLLGPRPSSRSGVPGARALAFSQAPTAEDALGREGARLCVGGRPALWALFLPHFTDGDRAPPGATWPGRGGPGGRWLGLTHQARLPLGSQEGSGPWAGSLTSVCSWEWDRTCFPLLAEPCHQSPARLSASTTDLQILWKRPGTTLKAGAAGPAASLGALPALDTQGRGTAGHRDTSGGHVLAGCWGGGQGHSFRSLHPSCTHSGVKIGSDPEHTALPPGGTPPSATRETLEHHEGNLSMRASWVVTGPAVGVPRGKRPLPSPCSPPGTRHMPSLEPPPIPPATPHPFTCWF